MDDDDVVLVFELHRVHGVVATEDLLLRLRQRLLVALQGVVNRLRDREELVGPGDDPPLDVEAGVFHQRNQCVIDLGDAAAERSRRQVDDPLARERFGEPADLLHQPARRERGVVRDGLMSDVDQLQHGWLPKPSGRYPG